MIKNKMGKKRLKKVLSILNSKPVIGLGIFIMLSLAMVFAGNVFVKDGTLTVENDFNGSNSLFVNQSTGKVGIGTNAPSFGLDVEKATGVTYAKFGSSLPTYITGNNPAVGFNSYWNSGWKFGKGSSASYAGILEFVPGTGIFSLKISDYTGNPDSTAVMSSKMIVEPDGDIGIGTESPNSVLSVGGPISTSLKTVTATYTVTASDSIIVIPANYFTINLPTASGITGREYTIKRMSNNSAPGSITVDPYSTQTIDGSATYSLSSASKYVQIVSDGSNWIVVGKN